MGDGGRQVRKSAHASPLIQVHITTRSSSRTIAAVSLTHENPVHPRSTSHRSLSDQLTRQPCIASCRNTVKLIKQLVSQNASTTRPLMHEERDRSR
jgi:hypothetical protein